MPAQWYGILDAMTVSSPMIEKATFDAALQQAVASFQAGFPQYGTPDGARDQCKVASARFCDALRAAGVPACCVWVDEIAIIEGVLHYGTVVHTDAGLVVVDASARQFTADAPWPLVLAPGEEWLVVPMSNHTNSF